MAGGAEGDGVQEATEDDEGLMFFVSRYASRENVE